MVYQSLCVWPTLDQTHNLHHSSNHTTHYTTQSAIGKSVICNIFKKSFNNLENYTYLYFFFSENIAIQDPFYKKLKPWAYCSVEEQYDMALAKNIHIQQQIKEMGITDITETFYYRE